MYFHPLFPYMYHDIIEFIKAAMYQRIFTNFCTIAFYQNKNYRSVQIIRIRIRIQEAEKLWILRIRIRFRNCGNKKENFVSVNEVSFGKGTKRLT